MTTSLDRIKVLINSNTPIILLETVEEARALSLIKLAASDLHLPVFEWSIADGLQRAGLAPASTGDDPRASVRERQRRIDAARAALAEANLPPVDFASLEAERASSAILNTKVPAQMLAHIETMTIEAVFVLKDFHRHLDDAVVVRRLRNLAQQFSRSRRALVLTGPAPRLPEELESQVERMPLPMPDREALRQVIESTYARLSQRFAMKRKLDDAGLLAMAANLCGLTEDEAERTLAQALVARYEMSSQTVLDVLEGKKELLRRSGLLEFVEVREDLAAVGGLENLKKWLLVRRGAFAPAAREYGLDPPRGVVLMGVQGCGKSLCARAIAGDWKVPLVKFQTSAVFDKFIGETEKRVQRLFEVADQLAPIVLWIDELEKVFAGTGPEAAVVDAGVSARMLGAFLSWMQDRRSAVFIAATSNNVAALPPELLRKGRFDEIFFLDLPNQGERRAIFALHLARRKRNPADFDLERLVDAARGFSGAEIEGAVQAAMYASFADQKPLSTETLLETLRTTVPLSRTRAEDIARLRAWAQERAVPASLAEA
jgi:SpoVK/Ycf46/Vps4 family AAA+-type ATPase